jgi:AAT family amino acid transporter/D-serine/D-alanine/glycine transporter
LGTVKLTDAGRSMNDAKQPAGEPAQFERRLRSRHIQLIAIGGTIGVGLFLGSAKAIPAVGPGLILSYALGGIVIFFIMRALGELLLYRPVAGSFAAYADEFVGPFAGFATAWSYWLSWVVAGIAELTAIGVYTHYWYPDIPQWVPALLTLGVLYATNMLAVRVFGELEFWFALIKVLTIGALIVGGLAIILFHLGSLGEHATFANLWSHGGFLPFGVLGVLLTLQMVMFAYTGVELVGVTAGEAANPEQVLPRAVKSIIGRILIFYVGALIVIMSLVPWNQLDPSISPFVDVFERIGIPGAADILNFVVITAAASSCNSGLFSTGRMLHTLAHRKRAAAAFGVLNRRHVPANAVSATAAVMLIGVGLNYFVPEEVFVWVTSIALSCTLWVWSMIMLSHMRYRRAVVAGNCKAVPFRMPGGAWVNWTILGCLAGVAGLLAISPSTRIALYVAPVWFAALGLAYSKVRNRAVLAPT